jgi:predicted nucleic acid-binding protein
MSTDDARRQRAGFEALTIERRLPERLYAEAWSIADELGLGRTYDCEYLALARLLDTRVVTLDGRLRRGAGRLGLVVDPTEL